jgi:hypothetical protein
LMQESRASARKQPCAGQKRYPRSVIIGGRSASDTSEVRGV